MSRKPPTEAFTRFTSTTPSFSSSPSFTSSQNASGAASSSQSPKGSPQASHPALSPETPQQRVARLRAAHQAKKLAEFSTTDRVLARGRTVADVLHRGTTYTLLGFSVIASGFAVYGLVSLVSHNRTQKRAWIERELDRLEDARGAFLAGTASAEQLHLLEQERAGEEIKKNYEREKQKRKDEGWFTSVRNLFRRGAGSGDMGAEAAEETLAERGQRIKQSNQRFEEEQIAMAQRRQPQRMTERGGQEVELRPAAVSGSSVPGVGLDEEGRPVPLSKMERVPVSASRESPVLDAVQARVREPGPLDVMAANVSNSGSDFWSSIFGSSRS